MQLETMGTDEVVKMSQISHGFYMTLVLDVGKVGSSLAHISQQETSFEPPSLSRTICVSKQSHELSLTEVFLSSIICVFVPVSLGVSRNRKTSC